MTFNDIFKSSFLDNVKAFSMEDTILGLAVALVIGLFIFLVYKKTLTGVMYSNGFALTLVGLSLVTTLVIMAVAGILVVARHHQNISRLKAGTESKFYLKKKK